MKLTRLKKPLIITGVNYREKDIKRFLVNKHISRVFQFVSFLFSYFRTILLLRLFLRNKKSNVLKYVIRSSNTYINKASICRESLLGSKVKTSLLRSSTGFKNSVVFKKIIRLNKLKYKLNLLLSRILMYKCTYLFHYINKADNNIHLKYSLVFFKGIFALLRNISKIKRYKLFSLIRFLKKVQATHVRTVISKLDPEQLPYYSYLNKVVDYFKNGTLVQYILKIFNLSRNTASISRPLYYVSCLNQLIRIFGELTFIVFPSANKYLYSSLLYLAVLGSAKITQRKFINSTFVSNPVNSDLDKFYIGENALFHYKSYRA